MFDPGRLRPRARRRYGIRRELPEEVELAIDYEKRDGVAYITLNNPEKANILDKPTSDAISEAWIDLWEDRDIRCAILTGAGDRHFCGGHNLAPRDEHHRGGTRIPAHPAHLLAARRHRAWPEDRRRWADGRPLPAGMEAGHRRGQRLGGGGRALHPAVLDRYPHRQPRARPVQIRIDDRRAGSAMGRAPRCLRASSATSTR